MTFGIPPVHRCWRLIVHTKIWLNTVRASDRLGLQREEDVSCLAQRLSMKGIRLYVVQLVPICGSVLGILCRLADRNTLKCSYLRESFYMRDQLQYVKARVIRTACIWDTLSFHAHKIPPQPSVDPKILYAFVQQNLDRLSIPDPL